MVPMIDLERISSGSAPQIHDVRGYAGEHAATERGSQTPSLTPGERAVAWGVWRGIVDSGCAHEFQQAAEGFGKFDQCHCGHMLENSIHTQPDLGF